MADSVDVDLYADVDEDFGQEQEDFNDAELFDELITSRPGGHEANPGESQSSKANSATTKTSSSFNKGNKIQLYIGNLTWWTTDRDLTDAVTSLGVSDLLDIKFAENKVNGQSKGCATIAVGSEHSSRLVLEKLPQSILHGEKPVAIPCSKQMLSQFEVQAPRKPEQQSPMFQNGALSLGTGRPGFLPQQQQQHIPQSPRPPPMQQQQQHPPAHGLVPPSSMIANALPQLATYPQQQAVIMLRPPAGQINAPPPGLQTVQHGPPPTHQMSFPQQQGGMMQPPPSSPQIQQGVLQPVYTAVSYQSMSLPPPGMQAPPPGMQMRGAPIQMIMQGPPPQTLSRGPPMHDPRGGMQAPSGPPLQRGPPPQMNRAMGPPPMNGMPPAGGMIGLPQQMQRPQMSGPPMQQQMQVGPPPGPAVYAMPPPHGGGPPPRVASGPPPHAMPPAHQGGPPPASHVNPAFYPHQQQMAGPTGGMPPPHHPQGEAFPKPQPAYPPSHADPYNRPPERHEPAVPQISEAEMEEILQRNKTVSSSAISRAVADASSGDFASAIETLVTAISLIRQSKIANDDRCQILISSLKDTQRGIEEKSYGSKREHRSSRSQERERHREKRSRHRTPSREREYRERSPRERERERSDRRYESERHYEPTSSTAVAPSSDRHRSERGTERGSERDREREYKSSRH